MTSDNEMADKTAKLKRLEEVAKHLKLHEDDIRMYFPSDLRWLISELRLAWKELEQSERREKILEEALVKIDRNGCELLNHECSSCDAHKALSEVRKMRGESE